MYTFERLKPRLSLVDWPLELYLTDNAIKSTASKIWPIRCIKLPESKLLVGHRTLCLCHSVLFVQTDVLAPAFKSQINWDSGHTKHRPSKSGCLLPSAPFIVSVLYFLQSFWKRILNSVQVVQACLQFAILKMQVRPESVSPKSFGLNLWSAQSSSGRASWWWLFQLLKLVNNE